jgi:hypothetical protein
VPWAQPPAHQPVPGTTVVVVGPQQPRTCSGCGVPARISGSQHGREDASSAAWDGMWTCGHSIDPSIQQVPSFLSHVDDELFSDSARVLDSDSVYCILRIECLQGCNVFKKSHVFYVMSSWVVQEMTYGSYHQEDCFCP